MTQDPIVLHVLVVGFHHKKGCQVEFAFPPLCPDAPEAQGLDLPDPWKHLPSLALPDGAHNYQKDTIYFHLPSLERPHQTIYGISCFRQMNSEYLKNRSEDITRGSVQKSVCVLSLLPLYGLIQTKLELITHAYFEERDFSQVSLLEETYKHLNATLSAEQIWGSQLFLGLSVRDLILQFKHKVLILFKLFLLERKVLFYKSPVQELCSTILTVCSLFPGMLEKGLSESTSSLGCKQVLPAVPENALDTDSVQVAFTDADIATRLCQKNVIDSCLLIESGQGSNPESLNTNVGHSNVVLPQVLQESDNLEKKPLGRGSNSLMNKCSPVSNSHFYDDANASGDTNVYVSNNTRASDVEVMEIEDELLKEIDEVLLDKTEMATEAHADLSSLPSSSSLVTLDLESCGFPLSIFTKGSMCLPYLSLPFIEALSDLSVRSCVVGATNVLFKQKRNLFDVIVEIESGKIDICDLELNRQLNLTMEDLRFGENLVQHVIGENKDVFLDGTGWEGGDEWLRAQFRLYLLSLLKTANQNDGRDQEAFNASFIQAFQETHNFKVWKSAQQDYLGLLQAEAKHPYFKGQITMADMKLKLSHSMQNTEKGRKINQAVSSTGKAVLQTGRAVGGAFVSARSFVSSWLSSNSVPPNTCLTEVPPAPVEKSPEIEMKVLKNESVHSDIS